MAKIKHIIFHQTFFLNLYLDHLSQNFLQEKLYVHIDFSSCSLQNKIAIQFFVCFTYTTLIIHKLWVLCELASWLFSFLKRLTSNGNPSIFRFTLFVNIVHSIRSYFKLYFFKNIPADLAFTNFFLFLNNLQLFQKD